MLSVLAALTVFPLTAGFAATALDSFDVGLDIDHSYVYLDEGVREDMVAVQNTTNVPLDVLASVEPVENAKQAYIIVWPMQKSLRPGQRGMIHLLLADPGGETESLYRLHLAWRLTSSAGAATSHHQTTLPLLVHPLALPRSINPWPYLSFRLKSDGKLVIENPSRYVLPLSAMIEFVPEKRTLMLPKTVLLPGESIHVENVLPELRSTAVSVTPTDLSGKVLPKIEIPLLRGS